MDIRIENATFVNEAVSKLTNLEHLKGDRTLLEKIIVVDYDSVLVLENSSDRFTFERYDQEWQNASVKVTSGNFEIAGIRVGLTSEAVFRLLDYQADKPVPGKRYMVCNQAPEETCVSLFFSDDHLVLIKM